MIRIVIVDDDEVFYGIAEEIIQKFFEEREETVSVRGHVEGSALLDELELNRRYDIYFLDVEMPGMNGLDLAREIKSREKDAKIIFLSAYEKYVLPSYKIQAYYYILKEECRNEIPVILSQICQERLDAEKDYYVIQNVSCGKRMPLNDIIYLLREKKYVVFRCAGGMEYRERGTLGEIYSKLPNDRFIYIDRGYIINTRHVSCWKGNTIKLDSGIELTASRRMTPAVREALVKFWREG